MEKDKYDILISWSGRNSNKIALVLKETLEKGIFKNDSINAFVSSYDIEAGNIWDSTKNIGNTY